jgi:hypothetical protein
VVEHRLAKARVAGSSPVSRSNLRSLCFLSWQSRVGIRAVCRPGTVAFVWSWLGRVGLTKRFHKGRGTQVVRERSAKPLNVGSIPTRASKSFASI